MSSRYESRWYAPCAIIPHKKFTALCNRRWRVVVACHGYMLTDERKREREKERGKGDEETEMPVTGCNSEKIDVEREADGEGNSVIEGENERTGPSFRAPGPCKT